MEMEFTTACDENGILTGMKGVIIADTGAYASLGGPVLHRACTHAAGPYNYQNIDIFGMSVYTNNTPSGAYRGFGVTQSCFATEQNINQLAQMVGISPFEMRYINALRPGDILPNGQIADKSTALVETLDAVREIYENNPDCGIPCAIKNSGLGVGVPDTGRCRIEVKNGKMSVVKKYRGHYDKCLGSYVKERLANREDIDRGILFVTYTQVSDACMESVEKAVAEHGNFETVYKTVAGSTVSCHCGPGTLGVLFVRK
jgi:hypothetical protein